LGNIGIIGRIILKILNEAVTYEEWTGLIVLRIGIGAWFL
jgi:hypothetical protein